MSINLGSLRLFTLAELSEKLGLTIVTLRSYIKKGKLKGRKLGTKWFISEESLREFFQENEPDEKRKRISLRGIADGGTLEDEDLEDIKKI